MSATAKDSGNVTRVSSREVKEETYRALRSTGYTWGEAQAAGRGYTYAQVLWGSGVARALADAKRRRVEGKRPSLVKSGVDQLHIRDPRRTSDVVVGAHAVSLALARPDSTIFIRGDGGGREVAVSVWDLRTAQQPMVWGRRRASGLQGFSIDEAGYLYWQESIPREVAAGGLSRRSWFVRQTALPAGRLVLAPDDRIELVNMSNQNGVIVELQQWEKLMRKANKFLVDE